MRSAILLSLSLGFAIASGCGSARDTSSGSGGADGGSGTTSGGGGAGGSGGVACTTPPAEPKNAPFARIVDSDLDPMTDRLCDESAVPPDQVPNPWDLHCKTTSGRGAKVAADKPKQLRIVEWNIERGEQLDGVEQFLEKDPIISKADVILLAEVDRGCTRTGGVDVARTLGEALGMDWAFGVEFIELAQGGCEEGNAILSRYPLGNLAQQFHDVGSKKRGDLRAPYDWFTDAAEPRLGRRSFVGADIEIDGGQFHVVAAHLENRSTADERAGEAGEIIDALDALPRPGAVIAGDFNVFPNIGDTVIDKPLFDRMAAACFVNPHADMPQEKRRTRPSLSYQIDFTYVRAVLAGDHGVQNQDPSPPSDHWPIWADVSF